MFRKFTWLACATLLCALLIALPSDQVARATEAVENVTTIKFVGGTTTQEDIDEALGEGAVSYTSEEIDGETVYTIKLLKNITMKAGNDVRIGEYRENGPALPQMILDLNGCTITSQSIGLINYGDLIIRDTSDAKTGTIKYSTTNDNSALVAISHQGGLLEIEGGTFICESGYAFTGYVAAVSTQAGATTHIKGGTFVSNSSAVLSSGETVVYGGTFNAPYGMYAKSADGVPGTITIPEESTAVVNASSFALVIQRDNKCDGKIFVAGGTYNASNVVGGVRSPDTVTAVSITGGTYTADPEKFVNEEGKAVAKIVMSGETTGLFFVGDSIAEKAAVAGEGDQITVKKGSIDLTNVPDGVIVSNSGGGNVNVNGEVVKEDPVTTHTHTYGNPVWTWTGVTVAEATFTCTKDGTHTEKVTATISSEVTKVPTCTETGETTYTAKVTFDGAEYTDKKVANIEMKAHAFVNGVCTVCGAREDAPAPTSTPAPAPTAPPKTGDSAHPLLWSVVLLAALLGAGLLCAGLRKRFR